MSFDAKGDGRACRHGASEKAISIGDAMDMPATFETSVKVTRFRLGRGESISVKRIGASNALWGRKIGGDGGRRT